jgi:hypothetical protein
VVGNICNIAAKKVRPRDSHESQGHPVWSVLLLDVVQGANGYACGLGTGQLAVRLE